ncbi:hypothetical protein EW146_g5075 [Bondarzewia mesenterica]|uniref:FAD-binding domain-containing protein n=1 Tax=Bondarzewia mesenterica TaxID=1095465 RepID=A0A4V3XEY5_9AGAM|nr:hypothetical protein EW146_g5075 [Bondarzewia mesenterica]
MAPLKLDILIVGAGMAGLASACALASDGHRVRLLEAAPELSNMGGAIRLPPNAVKVLMDWGLHGKLQGQSSIILTTTFCDLRTGEVIKHTEWQSDVFKDSGGEFHMIGHRDLCQMLYAHALFVGVNISFNSKVVAIIPPSESTPTSSLVTPRNVRPNAGPSVRLSTGETLHADLIIGADGSNSILRPIVDRRTSQIYTGTTMYTGIVDAESVENNPRMKDIVELGYRIWMGERCYAMAPRVQNTKEYAFHLAQIEDLPENEHGASSGWRVVPSTNVRRDGLNTQLQFFLDSAPTLTRARCFEHPSVEDWVDPSRGFVLIGQAAHPMLPCAMHQSSDCLESASVLSTLLSHLRKPSQLSSLLYAYEDLRASRAPQLSSFELLNRSWLSLPGALGVARNEDMRAAAVKSYSARPWAENANGDGDNDGDDGGQDLAKHWAEIAWLWGYDAGEDAEDWWIKWGVLRERATLEENPDGNGGTCRLHGYRAERGHGFLSIPVSRV